jgi:hypothetical protein
VERSKMNQTSERKCKMQQQMPKIVLLAVNISATLHRRERKDQSLKDACIHNVNSVCVCVWVREWEKRPFQSAGTFNLVTTAPHSSEVVSTTLRRKTQRWINNLL